MAIDIHNHCIPQSFLEALRRGEFAPALRVGPGVKGESILLRRRVGGEEREFSFALGTEYHDLANRLRDMDRMGVERQVLSLSPPLLGYWLEPARARDHCQALNDALALEVAREPKRFNAMAAVPLQDPPAAARELERAVREKGHVGVEIGSNVEGENLDEAKFFPFFEAAEALGVPIFVHPNSSRIAAAERLGRYHLRNLIGNPLDTTIFAASLVFGGVLRRYPRLRVVLSHAGGFLPFIRGRWQHGYGERPEAKESIPEPPERYIPSFLVDTIIHYGPAFRYVVETFGTDHVLYGTDYPADMGNLGPAREIPGLRDFSPAAQEQILSGNARRLYGFE